MKLEKFDLEKALNGAKVVTRDGREVTQLTKFEARDSWELYGVVDGKVCEWFSNGIYAGPHNPNNDLFLAVEPQRIWVNAYHHNGKLWLGGAQYNSPTRAKLMAGISTNMNYIKTIEITDEL
jgi:galactose mutarotase-like enzyme